MVLDDEDNGGVPEVEDFDVTEYYDDDDLDDGEEDDEDFIPTAVEDEETLEPQWFENGLDELQIPTLVLVIYP